jgi:hypothetical protein
MPTFQLCWDFKPPLFNDNDKPPSPLNVPSTMPIFTFEQLGGSQWLVNETGGEQGLQFLPPGLKITLPASFKVVRLRIGTFAAPVHIEAQDKSGTTVAKKNVPLLQGYTNTNLQAPAISSVTLTEGGGEGVLARICVPVSIP